MDCGFYERHWGRFHQSGGGREGADASNPLLKLFDKGDHETMYSSIKSLRS